MLSAADRDEVEKAIRHGINDAYRLGMGAAITEIEKFVDQSTDPQTFLRAIDSARRLSVNCTPKDR